MKRSEPDTVAKGKHFLKFVGVIVTLTEGVLDEKEELKCLKMLQFRDEKIGSASSQTGPF